ncbi:MAG: homocysteine S-methyltransferase family protein [Magnetospirillum sp.]|nr:homocysteine S-methyltransferase family protein [Magnetospirillum sp.]
MSASRAALPHLSDTPFLTDGGLETTLVFHEGRDLPCFAAFPLLDDEAGRAQLRRYFEGYLRIAAEHGAGFVLDTPTWRANADWAVRLGYPRADVADINRRAVAWSGQLRDAFAAEIPVLVNGVVGPRGDGYRVEERMAPDQAQAYHAEQIEAFAGAGVDMVSAVTINYAEEAMGIVRAAQAAGVPAVVAFTVETDGGLASGEPLLDAIERVDAATGQGAAYFMVNCAHPTHFSHVLDASRPALGRIVGVRANASTKSHAELDESTELDAGDPGELAGQYQEMRLRLPRLSVLGGCCGTDHRHLGAIAARCL